MKKKKAEKAVETGDLETALSIFMTSLKKDPNDLEALWQLGNINEEKMQYPEAIGYYSKLVEIGKESKLFTMFELYKRIGLLYKKIGRDQDALEFLLQAYNYIQSSKDVLENIAVIIFSQKLFHRALNYFEKGIQIIHNHADFDVSYGFCLVMVGRENEALPLLEEADRLEPHQSRTRMLLAYTYYKIGAYQKAREYLEEIINTDRSSLSIEKLYFSLKILLIIYLKEKNFDIVRELISQMNKLNESLNNETYRDENATAYIFFRVKQGYFDMALEEIGRNVELHANLESLDQEEKHLIKQNKSHIYELVSALDKYKKEQEKAAITGSKKTRFDVEYSMVENRAIDAQKKMDQIYLDWEEKFIQCDPLWDLFGPKPSVNFDPTLLLEKYSQDNIRTLKEDSVKKTKQVQKEAEDSYFSEDTEKETYPCERIHGMDFPTFIQTVKGLAENMGLQIINQALKVDPISYGDGQAVDMMCMEKYKKDSRVLFCFRRWKESIGYIPMTEILSAVKTFKANRLILISTATLSPEASRSIEGNTSVNFYLCEDVENYLRDVEIG